MKHLAVFRKPVLIPLLAAITMAYVPCSSADSNNVLLADGGWDVRTAAYLWTVGINGTQTVNGEEADLEVEFSDILDILDFAAEVHLEAIKDKQWGLFLDATYLKLGPEATNGPVDIRIGYKYWLVELGGSIERRAGQRATAGPPSICCSVGATPVWTWTSISRSYRYRANRAAHPGQT